MSESLRRKKKGIWSQGPFPLFFLKQNGTPSCNSKINEWINVHNTINRYLQSVEHQVK